MGDSSESPKKQRQMKASNIIENLKKFEWAEDLSIVENASRMLGPIVVTTDSGLFTEYTLRDLIGFCQIHGLSWFVDAVMYEEPYAEFVIHVPAEEEIAA